ncbi:MAG: sulfonate ABC transporter permease [Rhodospirillales bacterium 20-64-7]|nr:MAG: sulfonate ABC transporter permease [Rhodospirillales bacterium 20-64-7]
MKNFAPPALAGHRLPNRWDGVAALLVMGLLVALVEVGRHTFGMPIASIQGGPIHLEPSYLPGYALRTTARMFAALFFSLVFTFTYATLAAKSRRAGLVLIPILDILQSVPILGFLTFTVVFFMQLFPGRVLGAELAAIFVIFTSQAWNMAFSFYQSLTTLPADLQEAARSFRLSPWQKFWRLDVPFAMPGLVWNTMLSMSGGWFFVVASEAVTVGNTTFALPGIGSYVALALERRDLRAILYAILAMLVVILLYDQLVFRPLVAWSAKFRFETTASSAVPEPWMLKVLRRTRFFSALGDVVGSAMASVFRLRLGRSATVQVDEGRTPSRLLDGIWYMLIALAAGYAAWRIGSFIAGSLDWRDLGEALLMGFYTMLRVVVLMAIAALVWVPIGVWIGLRPKATRIAQPIAPGQNVGHDATVLSLSCAAPGACVAGGRFTDAASHYQAFVSTGFTAVAPPLRVAALRGSVPATGAAMLVVTGSGFSTGLTLKIAEPGASGQLVSVTPTRLVVRLRVSVHLPGRHVLTIVEPGQPPVRVIYVQR